MGKGRQRSGKAVGLGGCLAALALNGCVFDLAPLEQAVGGAGGTSQNGAGNEAGTDPGGAGGSGDCGTGMKSCDSKCVDVTDPDYGCTEAECDSCLGANVEEFSCAQQSCTIAKCTDGTADCDADPSNGCEADFTAAPEAGATVTAVERIIAEPDDWDGIGPVALKDGCGDCWGNNSPFARIAAKGAPPMSDLQAQVSLAWDDDNLYLLVVARDDVIVLGDSMRSPMNNVPPFGDGLQLIMDTAHNGGSWAPDDNVVSVNANGVSHLLFRDLTNDNAIKASVAMGEGCYTINASVDWAILLGNSGVPDAPAPGVRYGFSLGVLDADDANTEEYDHALFTQMPGMDFWLTTDGLGEIELLGP